jgi:hypothetical protein
MGKSPSTDMTFFRIGQTPGSRMHLLPVQWSKCSTPLTDGMNPLCREVYSDHPALLLGTSGTTMAHAKAELAAYKTAQRFIERNKKTGRRAILAP